MAHAPHVEPALAAAFGGTGLLQGGASDYVMALAIACAFPLMRVVMDRCVYSVRGWAGGGVGCSPGQGFGAEAPLPGPATAHQHAFVPVLAAAAGALGAGRAAR